MFSFQNVEEVIKKYAQIRVWLTMFFAGVLCLFAFIVMGESMAYVPGKAFLMFIAILFMLVLFVYIQYVISCFLIAFANLVSDSRKSRELLEKNMGKKASESSHSEADDLIVLKRMLDDGLLSQSEFDIKKQQILSK